MSVKRTNTNIQSPVEANILSLRDCFAELNSTKFGSLLLLCTCLLLARSSNLSKAADWAKKSGGGREFSSNYVRFCRFFATGIGHSIQKGVLRAVIRLSLSSRFGGGKCLVIDRTDWQHGALWRNLLVIGLCFEGYLVPLVWADLGARGCSGAEARMQLLEKLADWWPQSQVPLREFPLVGDREFGGEGYLLRLAKMGFSFVMRIKSNRQLHPWLNDDLRHRTATARGIRRYLDRYRLKSLEIALEGEYLARFVAIKNQSRRDPEPYLYLLTNLGEPAQADQCYQARYTIECCFKHLKTNGFDLENQNLAQVHQVEILMALLALLYTVCVASGIIEQHQKLERGRKIKFKTYKNHKKSLDRSLFRAGLTWATGEISAPLGILYFVNELFDCLSIVYDT